MNKNYSIYGNLLTNNSGVSQTLSSTTISASTGFFGKINPIYIGTGTTVPNWVTHDEFSYLSGITAFTQTQINEKPFKTESYVTYSGDNALTNSKVLSGGNNILFYSSTTHYAVSASFKSLIVGSVQDTPILNENKTVNNYFPSGYSDTYPNKITQIFITTSEPLIQITGLSANTTQNMSRVMTLTNSGEGVIILTPQSTGSTTNNRFILLGGETLPYFLGPNKSITFIHTGVNWLQISSNSIKNGLQNFSFLEDMTDYTTAVTGGANKLYNNDFLSYSGVGTPSSGSYADGSLLVGEYGFRMNIFNTNHGQILGSFGSNNNVQLSGNNSLFFTKITNNIATTNTGGTSTSTSCGFIGDYGLSTPFSARTNNTSSNFPNFSGGSFWELNTDFSPFWYYCVQTSDGGTIYSASTKSFTNTITQLGVFTINGTTNNFGNSSFFYRNLGSDDFTIYPKISHTGITATSFPSIRFECGYRNAATSGSGAIRTIVAMFGSSNY